MKRREAKVLGLTTYNNGKPCSRGHTGERRVGSGVCVQCSNDKKREKRWKERTDLKDEHKIISREEAKRLGLIYYYTAKACKHGHNAERYTKTAICKECNRLNSEKRRHINPEYAKEFRERNKGNLAKKRKEDPYYGMLVAMREMLRRVRRLTGLKKAERTEALMGYSRGDLVNHLQSLFEPGMSWENHGKWHIDHIIPITVMLKRGITDPKVINGLNNLQPLWAADNHRKSAKVG